MTIKVNIEFTVNETNPESMNTLARFFSAFEAEKIKTAIDVDVDKIRSMLKPKSPFAETSSNHDYDGDEGFIPHHQIEDIVDFLSVDNKPARIEGYERKFIKREKGEKGIRCMSQRDASDVYTACRCLANEALSGGLKIIGKTYSSSKNNVIRASVSVKDFNNTYHDISFSRMHNDTVLTPNQVNQVIHNYMVELGIQTQHDPYFGQEQRNKTKISLPSDEKPE